MDPSAKVLRIKVGVCKRVSREASAYRSEAELQKKRESDAVAAGDDVHKLKHHRNLLQEALMMVPDADRRLKKACEELKEIVDSEQNLKDTDDYRQALKVLDECTKQLSEYEQEAA